MGIERIPEFTASLKTSTNPDVIEALCKQEMKYLCANLASTSVRKSVTNYRNAIRKLDEKHPALQWLVVSNEDQIAERQRYKSVVYNRLGMKRPIRDYEAFIARAEKQLHEDSYIRVAIGLMALTGRRAIEIFKTGSFDLIPRNQEWLFQDMAIFSGQAKTRGAEGGKTDPYPIPVLTTPTDIVQAVARLRQLRDFQDLDHTEIHNRTSKTLNEVARRLFKDLVPDVKPKDLRPIYALIAHHIYCPPDIDQDRYIAEVLGHSKDDVGTAQSYKDFYLVESE